MGDSKTCETLKASAREGAPDVTGTWGLRPFWACASSRGEVRWPVHRASGSGVPSCFADVFLQQIFPYHCPGKCVLAERLWGYLVRAPSKGHSCSRSGGQVPGTLHTDSSWSLGLWRNVHRNGLWILTCLLIIYMYGIYLYWYTHIHLYVHVCFLRKPVCVFDTTYISSYLYTVTDIHCLITCFCKYIRSSHVITNLCSVSINDTIEFLCMDFYSFI